MNTNMNSIAKIPSYGKIYALDHALTLDTLKESDDILVQEKIDGSQFSFGVFDGQLSMRSRNVQIYEGNVPKMFSAAVDTVLALYNDNMLQEGWTYRGESLRKPKHNTAVYSRVPKGHIALFDIDIGNQYLIQYHFVAIEAERLGLDVVPLLASGQITVKEIRELVENTESYLGNTKIEGVVIKHDKIECRTYDKAGKVVMAKYVSDEFTERNMQGWKNKGMSRGRKAEVFERIAETVGTERRFEKALEKVRDDGQYKGTVADIGPAITHLKEDIITEDQDFIKEILWKEFEKDIIRMAVRPFPAWRKQQLPEEQL